MYLNLSLRRIYGPLSYKTHFTIVLFRSEYNSCTSNRTKNISTIIITTITVHAILQRCTQQLRVLHKSMPISSAHIAIFPPFT